MPKFKVGDWVITHGGSQQVTEVGWHNSYGIYWYVVTNQNHVVWEDTIERDLLKELAAIR